MLLSGMGYVLTSSGKLGSKNVISAETMSSGTGNAPRPRKARRTKIPQRGIRRRGRGLPRASRWGGRGGHDRCGFSVRRPGGRFQQREKRQQQRRGRERRILRPAAAPGLVGRFVFVRCLVCLRRGGGSAGAFPSCIHKYRRRWHFTSRKDIHAGLFYHSSAPRATEKALPLC